MLPEDEIFYIVCGEENCFLASILTTYGYKCADCYKLDILLTPDGVKTIPDSDETYSEYYSALLSMENVDELLLFIGGLH